MFSDWLQQYKLIKDFVGTVFPMVDAELQQYLLLLENCPSEELQVQARASIGTKRFHAQGGSVYALYPGVHTGSFVRFVVSLQTISDYLDNLCDRAGVCDEGAFRQLHLAMEAALDPGGETHPDYYRYYPYREDGGYLSFLVDNCRAVIRRQLPAYRQVQGEVLRLARLYGDLQSLKHLHPDLREEKLWAWAERHKPPELFSCEFAAATGSTLGMFMLAAAAARPGLEEEEVRQICAAYFPWITGLHILLDYFIDQEEDKTGGDLNFVFYYRDAQECEERLCLFLEQALAKAGHLAHSWFHIAVVEGLLAMYLSDPKAMQGRKKDTSLRLLRLGSTRLRLLHRICRRLRQQGRL